MELELSKKTMTACKTCRLSAEEMAFADLCSLNWEPVDAYIVAFRKGATWIKKALRDEVDKLYNSEAVQNRIAANRNVLSERQKEAIGHATRKDRNAIIDDAMSKEKMLYDLQTAVNTMTVGSKEWLDTKKLIVDVTRMKQDEVVNEEKTIHHFLPVHYPTGCHDCLYQRCDTCKYKKACNE